MTLVGASDVQDSYAAHKRFGMTMGLGVVIPTLHKKQDSYPYLTSLLVGSFGGAMKFKLYIYDW